MTHIQGLDWLKGHADTTITGLPNGFALMLPHRVLHRHPTPCPSTSLIPLNHFFLIPTRDLCPCKTEHTGPQYYIQVAFIVPLMQYKPEASSQELHLPFKWVVCFLSIYN